ncbi:leucine-rich repeat domain-containing protein [Haloplasma contractile]|uniref:Surface protein responsible for cell interaction contains cell adhesion domain containing p n=1 Tax=Haloplasma contractile SSD-17B TaxID=1033810 RepID=U2FLA7_9MOLU|nr:leucine-rich repeat domain-containing protein [Haloplasma contractile]ERJ11984.1 putative surface protein responsible for cell interaction contains cell adhesion domain containing p [Haloplasma contractile SSD-17B]
MFRNKWFNSLILFIAVLILSSCSDRGENEFLPEYCSTYNEFIYTTSDDFYDLLLDNGYTIDKDSYYESVVDVKTITYNEQITLKDDEMDLNGIECFPYIKKIELEGKSIKDLSPLTELKRVEQLTINNTRVMTLLPIRNMVKIKSLTVTNNANLRDLNGIESFSRLQTVDLSRNRLINISKLELLTNLEHIVLKDNDIQTIDSLSTLPKLTYLDIEHNRVDFNEKDTISGFKKLETLKGKSNRICETRAFSSFEQLKFLDLSDNNLMNALNDSSCTLTEPDFTFLNKVTTLESFYVTENELKNLDSLNDAKISHLKELNLSKNKLSSIEPLFYNQSIQNGSLTTLNISDNEPLTTIAGIHKIDSLEVLNARNNSINQIEDLFLLNNLVDADLSSNKIVALPNTVTQSGDVLLPAIQTLNLSNNNIESIDNFRENGSLITINLTDNNVKEISNSFNNMTELKTVLLTDVTKDDGKENQIAYIEDSFNNLANLEFEETGILRFNFTTKADTGNGDGLKIIGSFNEMEQFTSVDMTNYGVSMIDEDSFMLNNVLEFNASQNSLETLDWINNLPNLMALLVGDNKISVPNASTFEQSNVRILDLGNNKLVDIDFLQYMPGLELVNLESNFIDDVSVFNGKRHEFKELKELSLKNNQVQRVNGLTDLPSLTTLNLMENEITEINGVNDQPALSNLPTLTDLYFGNETHLTKINGLNALGITELDLKTITSQEVEISSVSLSDNHNMTELDISDKLILDGISNLQHGFSFISNLDYLESLNLSNTGMTDLTPLSNLTQLKMLALNYNHSVAEGQSLTDLSPLENLKNLEILALDGNNIQDVSTLQDYPNLEILSLQENNIGTLNGINQMPNLNMLSLYMNPIHTIDGLNNIGLDSLSLNSFAITEITSDSLKDNHFTDLDLSNQSLTNIEFTKNLTYLDTLNLSHNALTNISSLSYLKNLKELDLGHNNIDDISKLGTLSSLQKLYLNDNNITSIKSLQTGSSVLDALTQLEYLNLRENTITELTGLNNMVNLEELYLPTTITTFKDTLSGTNSLREINKQEPKNLFSQFDVTVKDLVIDNSFNSHAFNQIYMQAGFNETISGSFKKVTHLDLSHTAYSTSTQLSFIKDMDSLTTLIYNGTNIQTLSNVNCNANLSELDLSNSSITTVSNSFVNCSSLKEINLSNTGINDFTFIESNTNLESIDLRSLTIDLDTFTLDISNMSQLSQVDLSGTSIRVLDNSFNNNNKVTNIIFESAARIKNSFNNLPNFKKNSFSNTLFLISPENQIHIDHSFNQTSSINDIEFANYNTSVYISDSFNGATNVGSLSFKDPSRVYELSGFNNTSLAELQGFENLQLIEGFEQAKLSAIELTSEHITDAMINELITNIDQSSVEIFTIANSNYVSQATLNNINKLQNLEDLTIRYIDNVNHIDSISLELVNQLKFFKFEHDTPDENRIIDVLARKTTTTTILRIYPGNSGIDYETSLRSLFETNIRSNSSYMNTLETEITNQYDQELRETLETQYPDESYDEITIRLNEIKQEAAYSIEITNRINNTILEQVDDKMSKYLIY